MTTTGKVAVLVLAAAMSGIVAAKPACSRLDKAGYLRIAVGHELGVAGPPTSTQDQAVRAFLRDFPDCCRVTDTTRSGFAQKLFTDPFYTDPDVVVRLVYRRPDRTFVEVRVELDKCGKFLREDRATWARRPE